MNLAQCTLHISLLRCQLVSQQQDIPLGYGILGRSPGIFILLEGAVKAVLADSVYNIIGIADEGCLHLCPELRICLGGLGIAELCQCQGIIPGKEAWLPGDDVLLLRHEILLIFLVAGGAEQLRCQPAALGSIRSIVIRAGTAFLSLIHPVDGLLLPGKICPCLLGILQAVLGKCLVNVSIHPACHRHGGAIHCGAGSAGAVQVTLLCIGIRGLVKARPLGTGNLVEGAAVAALHLLHKLQLELYLAEGIRHILLLHALREEKLPLEELVWICLISHHQLRAGNGSRSGVLAIITGIIPAAAGIHHITLLVQLVSKINLGFLVLGMAADNLQPRQLVIHRRIAAGQGV